MLLMPARSESRTSLRKGRPSHGPGFVKPAEIFLSHSSKDEAFASRIAGTLSRHGLKVFYSRKSIRGAQQWHDEIGQALSRCNWFLIVLSPAA